MSAARTTTTAAARPPPAPAPAQASLYQQLRGHLAELKMHDAAGALPAVLDQASTEGRRGAARTSGWRALALRQPR
jgi:hypothetical protein